MANAIWRSLGLDIININMYAFVFQNNPYDSIGMVIFVLLTDYRQTHNFTNLLQSCFDEIHISNVFYFCGVINSGKFFIKGLFQDADM